MSRIRSRNTNPEVAVRKFLHSKGFRYRINYKVTGKPDIAFPRKKIAIFTHGCFWHQHGCPDSAVPKTNRKFWSSKLTKNKKRDIEVAKTLENDDWKVIELWECEIEKYPEKTFSRLLKELTV